MNPLLAIKAAKIALPAVGSIAKGVGSALSAIAGSDNDQAAKADTKVRKTADDFEKLFLEQTVDRLFASHESEGPLGENGTGGDVWRSLLSKEYAGQIQKSGGVGISNQVYDAILKLQAGKGGGA